LSKRKKEAFQVLASLSQSNGQKIFDVLRRFDSTDVKVEVFSRSNVEFDKNDVTTLQHLKIILNNVADHRY